MDFLWAVNNEEKRSKAKFVVQKKVGQSIQTDRESLSAIPSDRFTGAVAHRKPLGYIEESAGRNASPMGRDYYRNPVQQVTASGAFKESSGGRAGVVQRQPRPLEGMINSLIEQRAEQRADQKTELGSERFDAGKGVDASVSGTKVGSLYSGNGPYQLIHKYGPEISIKENAEVVRYAVDSDYKKMIALLQTCNKDEKDECIGKPQENSGYVMNEIKGDSYPDGKLIQLFPEGGSKSGFAYKNNPMDNPKAARDIVKNPDAVYGYSPNPKSTRIGGFASKIDWTNPDQVAMARQTRQKYHEGNEQKLQALKNQRYSTEEIAAIMVEERNKSRIDSYKENGKLEELEIMKKSNLETYGNELGMTLEQALEKYGSYEEIINAAIRSNPGMDACTGLYDIYYGGK